MGKMTTVDVTHAVRAISEHLGRYAVPSDDVPHANEHNVRIMRGASERKQKHVLFQFATREGLNVKIDVDLVAFLSDPYEYLDNLMDELVRGTNAAREARQQHTRIVIPGPEGLVRH